MVENIKLVWMRMSKNSVVKFGQISDQNDQALCLTF